MSSIENKGKVIYLDNAATTKMSEEVKEAMDPYLEEKFGNASTMYGYGETSRQALEKARKTIAGTLEAKPSEIFFTSGGSESDNWAVKCIAGEYKHKGKHIITSKIEHHAILNSCKYLEELGYEVTYLDVDEYGMVSPEAVYHAIREDTTLITIMFGNNEVGTIEPVFSIGKIAREKDVLFHTDAVQAYAQPPRPRRGGFCFFSPHPSAPQLIDKRKHFVHLLRLQGRVSAFKRLLHAAADMRF